MLTIDWKERLTQDTQCYLENKLPEKDYDFEIIFNAYPKRTNGKIPNKVINFVCGIIVRGLGKNHSAEIPFFRHLWLKKGDYGKVAFGAILAKLTHKEPELYLPLIEEMVQKAEAADISALLDKVMLPLCRKYPDKYLPVVFAWSKRDFEPIAGQSVELLTKLVRRAPELLPLVMDHIQNLWVYPLEDFFALHLKFLKIVARLDTEAYLAVWEEFGISRDPQIVELLCGSIMDYHPQLEAPVELWTKSGNARVKKASTLAMRLLNRKKEQ